MPNFRFQRLKHEDLLFSLFSLLYISIDFWQNKQGEDSPFPYSLSNELKTDNLLMKIICLVSSDKYYI